MKTIFLFCFFLWSSAFAKSEPLPSFADTPVKTLDSIKITRLSDHQTLFEKNAHTPLLPASTTKILVAAAALAKFGSTYKFLTEFYYTGTWQKNSISGDLHIHGDGDPLLISEKLWQMATDLKNMGLTEIKGNLILDNSLFSGPTHDVSRAGAEFSSENAYDAPISALAVNFNTLAVMASNAGADPKNVVIAFDPYPIPGFHLQNQVSVGLKNRIRASRKGADNFTVSGSVSSAKKLARVYISVADHLTATGGIIKAFLAAHGIKLRGTAREGRVSQLAKPFYSIESYPLSQMVTGLNKYSNNFIADMLVKRLGASFPQQGTPLAPGSGSFENGVAAVQKYLREEVGIKTPMVIENGSGLSVNNRLTAEQLVKLLDHMHDDLRVYPEFLASLPIAGSDGSLAERFRTPGADQLFGITRAKTGTLTTPVSVSGLAGYIQHPKHGLCAFAILFNGSKGAPQPSIDDLHRRQEQGLLEFTKNL